MKQDNFNMGVDTKFNKPQIESIAPNTAANMGIGSVGMASGFDPVTMGAMGALQVLQQYSAQKRAKEQSDRENKSQGLSTMANMILRSEL